jgi:hypothetical protein
MQLGMPYVHVSNGLHFDYSGYTPLCLHAWPHEITPAALARNREGVARWAEVLQSVGQGIRAHAENVGLKIDWNDRDRDSNNMLDCFDFSQKALDPDVITPDMNLDFSGVVTVQP